MKKLLLTFFVALSTLGISAKSMIEIWSSIPEELVPYVDNTHRLEMTDFIGMGLKGDVDNVMGSKSVMDTITNNFIHVTLSESATLEIKRLPMAEGDSILCVIRTWKAPEGESSVAFYDQNWEKIDKSLDIASYASQLYARPDTMSEGNYSDLVKNIDFTMVKASLSPSNEDLTLDLSVPTGNKDADMKLKSITKQKILHWNNGSY